MQRVMELARARQDEPGDPQHPLTPSLESVERRSASTIVEDGSRPRRCSDASCAATGSVAMTEDRPIEAILTEWRDIERNLEATEGETRRALDARFERLREEHRRAVASRDSEAKELRGR